MDEKKWSRILIGVLLVLVIGLSAFIVYDKINEKSEDSQVEQDTSTTEDEEEEDNKEESSNEDESEEEDESYLDASFDTTKEAINAKNGRAYKLTAPYAFGLSIVVNENKKSATITIDWEKYGQLYYDDTSGWSTEAQKYTVSNFSQNIKDVYIAGFGQSFSYETAFYIMEDGTVEYTPISHMLKENGVTKTTMKSYGTIKDISGVEKILTGIDYCLDESVNCLGDGLNILGVKSDGTFYNLSIVLHETDYYGSVNN